MIAQLLWLQWSINLGVKEIEMKMMIVRVEPTVKEKAFLVLVTHHISILPSNKTNHSKAFFSKAKNQKKSTR
jgi:hypothetical protein